MSTAGSGGNPSMGRLQQGRLALLALLLSLVSVAFVVAALAQAWGLTSQEYRFGDGARLEQFLRILAYLGANPVAVLFLVGALLLVLVGIGDPRPGAAHGALWVCFVTGLVLAGLALAASFDALWISRDGATSLVPYGSTEDTGSLLRLGAVLPNLAGAAVAVVVSWCAFQALPISLASPGVGQTAGSDPAGDDEGP